MELDAYLSFLARRIRPVLGTRHVRHWIGLLQQYYARRYRGRHDAWATIRDFDGDLAIRLDRASFMGSSIYWHGYFSFDELFLLDKILHESMVFADIGSNQGEFTLFAAKRLTSGKVLCVEPDPVSFKQLEENIALNKFSNVRAYNLALSDAAGELELYAPGDRLLSQLTHIPGLANEGVSTLFKGGSDFRQVGTARVERFDTLFEQLDWERLDIMKIDVEGAELPVLRGAISSLQRYRPMIMMELNARTFAAAGYTSADVIAFLTDLHYEFYAIENCKIRDAWRFGLLGRYGKLRYLGTAALRDLPDECDILCRCYRV